MKIKVLLDLKPNISVQVAIHIKLNQDKTLYFQLWVRGMNSPICISYSFLDVHNLWIMGVVKRWGEQWALTITNKYVTKFGNFMHQHIHSFLDDVTCIDGSKDAIKFDCLIVLPLVTSATATVFMKIRRCSFCSSKHALSSHHVIQAFWLEREKKLILIWEMVSASGRCCFELIKVPFSWVTACTITPYPKSHAHMALLQ